MTGAAEARAALENLQTLLRLLGDDDVELKKLHVRALSLASPEKLIAWHRPTRDQRTERSNRSIIS